MVDDEARNTEFAVFAHRLADSAGAAILPHFRQGSEITNKIEGAFDPVTEADRSAEAAMRREIQSRYPGHGIYGEEFPDVPATGPYSWSLDPIDGTRSFIMGLPIWGTLIGLLRDGEPTLGLMDQPYIGERFWNSGGGAFFRNRQGEQPIRTRRGTALSEAILTATAPDMFAANDFERFQSLSGAVRMTRFGGDCYLYCLLAMGFVDIVAETSLKPFDIAPLVPIIRAAGGIVTTWDGGDPSKGGRIVAAGDPALHEQAVKLLAG
jgi:myo-inositol-1(or 4)-monophosphatase